MWFRQGGEFLITLIVFCVHAVFADINGFFTKINETVQHHIFNPENDVEFILYTRDNRSKGQILKNNDTESIVNTNFNASHPTRILIHGWQSDGKSLFDNLVKEAYFEKGFYNVIVVDWSSGSKNVLYTVSRKRVPPVGKYVGSFINFLHNQGFVEKLEELTIVGHSLGAHIAGIAGKNAVSKVGAIWALDPAGPGFKEDQPNERLEKDDAILTVGVRTNTGLKNLGFSQGLGFSFPLAKIEFLANGGVEQPGCLVKSAGLTEFWSPCSHSRAYELFAESINHKEFKAIGCHSFENTKRGKCEETGKQIYFVGEDMDSDTPAGYYYFKTGRVSLFYRSIASSRLTLSGGLILGYCIFVIYSHVF